PRATVARGGDRSASRRLVRVSRGGEGEGEEDREDRPVESRVVPCVEHSGADRRWHLDGAIRNRYKRRAFWRHSQVVRQRSAKPPFPGSNPGGASRDRPL